PPRFIVARSAARLSAIVGRPQFQPSLMDGSSGQCPWCQSCVARFILCGSGEYSHVEVSKTRVEVSKTRIEVSKTRVEMSSAAIFFRHDLRVRYARSPDTAPNKAVVYRKRPMAGTASKKTFACRVPSLASISTAASGAPEAHRWAARNPKALDERHKMCKNTVALIT
ncbi:MAG: hypothetical protein WCH05_10615, partial [Chlorobiaceae bacterium]